MPRIPLLTVQGKSAQAEMEVTAAGGSECRITIGWEFAGRDVDEELDLAILQKLGGDVPFVCHDLIGLSFETDGTQIKGAIGAGSGNVGFLVLKSDWNAAMKQLADGA